MAISHAKPAEVINLQPLSDKIASSKTHTIFKTDAMEAIRLVLPAGKQIAEHKAPGEITVHCLEGEVNFSAGGTSHVLHGGEMLYLEAADPHAVEAIQDSTVLVTIIFSKG